MAEAGRQAQGYGAQLSEWTEAWSIDMLSLSVKGWGRRGSD